MATWAIASFRASSPKNRAPTNGRSETQPVSHYPPAARLGLRLSLAPCADGLGKWAGLVATGGRWRQRRLGLVRVLPGGHDGRDAGEHGFSHAHQNPSPPATGKSGRGRVSTAPPGGAGDGRKCSLGRPRSGVNDLGGRAKTFAVALAFSDQSVRHHCELSFPGGMSAAIPTPRPGRNRRRRQR